MYYGNEIAFFAPTNDFNSSLTLFSLQAKPLLAFRNLVFFQITLGASFLFFFFKLASILLKARKGGWGCRCIAVVFNGRT